MLTLEELKKDRETVSQIDWDLTPQEAYESYQIKSINSWKQRGLPDAYYWVIYVWRNDARLCLVRKTYKDSEEIAEIEAPAGYVRSCLSEQAGDPAPQGQYTVTGELLRWLKQELGVG
jgi:hypothetical protein